MQRRVPDVWLASSIAIPLFAISCRLVCTSRRGISRCRRPAVHWSADIDYGPRCWAESIWFPWVISKMLFYEFMKQTRVRYHESQKFRSSGCRFSSSPNCLKKWRPFFRQSGVSSQLIVKDTEQRWTLWEGLPCAGQYADGCGIDVVWGDAVKRYSLRGVRW